MSTLDNGARRVQPVAALTYCATVDVSARFRKSKSVRVVFGVALFKRLPCRKVIVNVPSIGACRFLLLQTNFEIGMEDNFLTATRNHHVMKMSPPHATSCSRSATWRHVRAWLTHQCPAIFLGNRFTGHR